MVVKLSAICNFHCYLFATKNNITQSLNLINVRSLIYDFKDVRAQNVPTYRYFLNLPRRKVMIYLYQKQKTGGHRLRFGENMPRRIL